MRCPDCGARVDEVLIETRRHEIVEAVLTCPRCGWIQVHTPPGDGDPEDWDPDALLLPGVLIGAVE